MYRGTRTFEESGRLKYEEYRLGGKGTSWFVHR